jgi:hypothetical protein
MKKHGQDVQRIAHVLASGITKTPQRSWLWTWDCLSILVPPALCFRLPARPAKQKRGHYDGSVTVI